MLVLEPDDRRLLLESLRPPNGYELDHALGTTFTLDLMALLTAPMAFTLFDSEGEDGGPPTDPVTLLRAVREYGDRVTIFCQGGQIAVPPHDQLLFANLEGSIYQVNLTGRLFHPKGLAPEVRRRRATSPLPVALFVEEFDVRSFLGHGVAPRW